jgi:hypothetical protein
MHNNNYYVPFLITLAHLSLLLVDAGGQLLTLSLPFLHKCTQLCVFTFYLLKTVQVSLESVENGREGGREGGERGEREGVAKREGKKEREREREREREEQGSHHNQ